MAWGYGNLGSSGGSNSIYGMIIVNYPEGSELTITGGRSSKKDLTSTQRSYYVKEAGTYTITSTDSLQGKSTYKNVIISELAQSVTITLSYILALYSPGDTSGWDRKGWAYSNGTGTSAAAPNLTYNPTHMYIQQSGWHSGIVYHNAVDFTEYTTLHATCSNAYLPWGGNYNSLLVMPNVTQTGTPYLNVATKYKNISIGDITIDISTLSGNYYVAFSLARDSNPPWCNITGVWLE